MYQIFIGILFNFSSSTHDVSIWCLHVSYVCTCLFHIREALPIPIKIKTEIFTLLCLKLGQNA